MIFIAKKLTALPSLIMDKDGNTKELDSLGAAEKQHIIGLLCKLVGEEMSEYYNINKEQWKIFSAEASA